MCTRLILQPAANKVCKHASIRPYSPDCHACFETCGIRYLIFDLFCMWFVYSFPLALSLVSTSTGRFSVLNIPKELLTFRRDIFPEKCYHCFKPLRLCSQGVVTLSRWPVRPLSAAPHRPSFNRDVGKGDTSNLETKDHMLFCFIQAK